MINNKTQAINTRNNKNQLSLLLWQWTKKWAPFHTDTAAVEDHFRGTKHAT